MGPGVDPEGLLPGRPNDYFPGGRNLAANAPAAFIPSANCSIVTNSSFGNRPGSHRHDAKWDALSQRSLRNRDEFARRWCEPRML